METLKKIGGMGELVLAIAKANQFFRDQAKRELQNIIEEEQQKNSSIRVK